MRETLRENCQKVSTVRPGLKYLQITSKISPKGEYFQIFPNQNPLIPNQKSIFKFRPPPIKT